VAVVKIAIFPLLAVTVRESVPDLPKCELTFNVIFTRAGLV
jgi:hypothetical protein